MICYMSGVIDDMLHVWSDLMICYMSGVIDDMLHVWSD